jgi:hypothetical protein
VLQVGRSRVRTPMRSLEFFLNLPNRSSLIMTPGLTQPLTEMSRIFLGVKVRSAGKADNSSTSVSRLSRKCVILNVSQSYVEVSVF